MSSDESTQIIGRAYLTTLQGVCKVIEAVASFVAVLLVGINYSGSLIRVFESASALSIIFAVIFLALYVSSFIANIPLPWNRIQFFIHSILSLYYLIATALVLDIGTVRLIMGGIIGLVAVVAHIVDAYDNYRKHRLFE